MRMSKTKKQDKMVKTFDKERKKKTQTNMKKSDQASL